ncbi:MAG: hypothetical protein M9894_18335 [Planctomycetes bacterium]|nr:hypothetical protein [Planctomycetota bacterium]
MMSNHRLLEMDAEDVTFSTKNGERRRSPASSHPPLLQHILPGSAS